jgi:hypothetical protein
MPNESLKKVGNFDVLKVMCERNMDVRLSTLDNVKSARKVKGGTLLSIGVSGVIVTGITFGKFVGGLLIADREQFNAVKSELEGKASSV